MASQKRYGIRNNLLIGELKKSGEVNPVIIDYGAGELTSTIELVRQLKKAGINGHIIATDKIVNYKALERKNKSRIAYVEHNLRTGPYLTGNKKADVIRLGYVLPYIF